MGNEAEALIHLDAVSKTFLTEEMETRALCEVSLRIEKGEYVSICGPSGCGKSTLLSIIGLLDEPTSGTFRLARHDVSAIGTSERARIRNSQVGFVFQAFNLIGDLTVEENVELPLTYRKDVPAVERRRRVAEAIARVGMNSRARHYPSQLSGGQQQRVAIARALAGQPAVLLADEPTGNLDSASGDAVMGLLEELHRDGSTICMVTHDARYADAAHRKIMMRDGRIV